MADLSIKRLPVPAVGTATHWDTLKGFGIRVSAGGARTFIVLIGSGRRQSIGRYPLISLSDARTEARRILAEKTLGRVRPTHTAYDDAVQDYLTECEKKNRSGTVKEYRRILSNHFPYGRQSIGDITPRDVVRKLNGLSAVCLGNIMPTLLSEPSSVGAPGSTSLTVRRWRTCPRRPREHPERER